MLDINYANDNVRYYFENLKAIKKEYGPELAKKVSQRKDELQSFNSVYELLNCGIDNPHLLLGDLDGCMGWDLSARIRLIIKISEKFEQDTIEKTKTMTSVVIEGVRDYHDGNKKWIID